MWIWCPNSRVGTKITACTTAFSIWINCKIGNPKAAVFPVPVFANPTISVVLSSNCGITFCWISVGSTIFNSVNACTIGFEIPNSENCFAMVSVFIKD